MGRLVKKTMNNIIVDHKNVVKKIPLNDKNVDEMLKTFNINYNTVSIDGHIMYKFYFKYTILYG